MSLEAAEINPGGYQAVKIANGVLWVPPTVLKVYAAQLGTEWGSIEQGEFGFVRALRASAGQFDHAGEPLTEIHGELVDDFDEISASEIERFVSEASSHIEPPKSSLAETGWRKLAVVAATASLVLGMGMHYYRKVPGSRVLTA